MREAFDTIQRAFAEAGLWRWWAAQFPNFIQVEFAGVQLYQAPTDPSHPPSGVFALQFGRPQLVRLLEFTSNAEPHWFDRLQGGELGPLPVDFERFCLGDDAGAERLSRAAACTHDHFTAPPGASSIPFAFSTTAGLGLLIVAERMRLVSHAGEIPMQSVAGLHTRWREYWRKYWDLRSTDSALPQDYACEACMPQDEVDLRRFELGKEE